MATLIRFVAAALLLTVPAGLAVAQSNPPPPPGSATTYLALGDSLAYGVTAPGIQPDPQCQSPTAPGYVCISYGYLHQADSSLQLDNLAVPDMDSCLLITGVACGQTSSGAGNTTPLQTAIDTINAHPGQVRLVSLDVGGADLIPLLPGALADPAGTAAKLPALFRRYQANLDGALSKLRGAVGPNGRIILITQYNPLGGIPSPPLPAGLPDIASGAIGAMNQIMKTEAAKYGVVVADVAAAFDSVPGGAATVTFVPSTLASGDPSRIDIYPTLDGYHLYARTVLKAIGTSVPFVVKLTVAHPSIRARKTEKVTIATVSGASLTFRLILPHAHPSLAPAPPAADNSGAASVTFPSGKHSGKGALRVCVADPVTGHSGCKKATFLVR
jgi:hypothetical protein